MGWGLCPSLCWLMLLLYAPTAYGGMALSADVLSKLCPSARSKVSAMLPHLNKAMAEGEINTCQRVKFFLAQLTHESGCFQYFEEIASGAAYEHRKDLGNTQPGDGTRYKGRGPIQLTGRANYAAAGKALGLDLVGNPQMVSTYPVGFRTTVWFWKSHGLNQIADKGDFETLTRRINGGTNGMADRKEKLSKISSILGNCANMNGPGGADATAGDDGGGAGMQQQQQQQQTPGAAPGGPGGANNVGGGSPGGRGGRRGGGGGVGGGGTPSSGGNTFSVSLYKRCMRQARSRAQKRACTKQHLGKIPAGKKCGSSEQCRVKRERDVMQAHAQAEGLPADGAASAPTGEAANTGDLRGRILKATMGMKGQSSANGPGGGNVACAFMVNKIMTAAGLQKIGSNPDFVPSVVQALNGGRGKKIPASQAKPGDIAIAPGEHHIGICVADGCSSILSNSSSKKCFCWTSPLNFSNFYGSGATVVYQVLK